MLFRPEHIEKIQRGAKTQTRRLAKPGDEVMVHYESAVVELAMDDTLFEVGAVALHESIAAVRRKQRPLYVVGKQYAMQRGRFKHSEGSIRITAIREERVGDISDADALAEGFDNRQSFFKVIAEINGLEFNFALAQKVYALTFERVK